MGQRNSITHLGQVLVHLPTPLTEAEASMLSDEHLLHLLKLLASDGHSLARDTKRRFKELLKASGKGTHTSSHPDSASLRSTAVSVILQHRIELEIAAPHLQQYVAIETLCHRLPMALDQASTAKLVAIFEELDAQHVGRIHFSVVRTWIRRNTTIAACEVDSVLFDRLQVLVRTAQPGMLSCPEFIHFIVVMCTATEDELVQFAYCSIANDTTADGSRVINVPLLRDRLLVASAPGFLRVPSNVALLDELSHVATSKYSLFAAVVMSDSASDSQVVAFDEFRDIHRRTKCILHPILSAAAILVQLTLGAHEWAEYRQSALRLRPQAATQLAPSGSVDIVEPRSVVTFASRRSSAPQEAARSSLKETRSGSRFGSRTSYSSARTMDMAARSSSGGETPEARPKYTHNGARTATDLLMDADDDNIHYKPSLRAQPTGHDGEDDLDNDTMIEALTARHHTARSHQSVSPFAAGSRSPASESMVMSPEPRRDSVTLAAAGPEDEQDENTLNFPSFVAQK